MKTDDVGFFVGIKAEGNSFICGIGCDDGEIVDKIVVPTTTPDETLTQVIQYIKAISTNKPINAIGIASFGPLDLDRNSKTYGYITSTAKPGWVNCNFVGTIKKEFSLPLAFDTDVNGAVLGEHKWGAAKGLSNFVCFVVGVGIGAGVMINGKILYGNIHTEVGHMFIPHNENKDKFHGVCPYHGNYCLEGLASEMSMKERWKIKNINYFPISHPGWDLEADYLAMALLNCTLTLSPERIVLNGIFKRNKELISKIRKRFKIRLNGYLKNEKYGKNIKEYIVESELQELAAVYGAISLAKESYLKSLKRL